MGKGTVNKPRQSEGRARVSQTAKMGVAEEAERCALLLSDFSAPQPQRTPVNSELCATQLENQNQTPHSTPISAWSPNSKTKKVSGQPKEGKGNTS